MRAKTAWAVILTVAFVMLLVGWTRQPQRQKWEYKVEYHGTISEKKLNEMGMEGWELIAAEAGNSNVTSFYFKRPKP